MKLILFEAYYRGVYIFITVCFIECFTYFIEGTQLEYFSSLFTFSYQAIEFDFCEDTQLQTFFKQKQQVLPAIKSFCAYSFFTLSTNEAKAWFYLFIVYLSYFYCVELDKVILYYLLTYIKVTHVLIFIVVHSRGGLLPGLLKKSVPTFVLTGSFLPLLTVLLNHHFFLVVIFSFKELQLEPLDSELI